MKKILSLLFLTIISVRAYAHFGYSYVALGDTSVYTQFSFLNGYLSLQGPANSEPLEDVKLMSIAQEKSLPVLLQDGLQISSRLCLAVYCVDEDFSDDPVQIWNRIFSFGDTSTDFLFESGSFTVKEKNVYFLKMKSSPQDGYPYYKLMFFTNVDRKLLYGTINGYQMSYGEWSKEAEEILGSIEISEGLK